MEIHVIFLNEEAVGKTENEKFYFIKSIKLMAVDQERERLKNKQTKNSNRNETWHITIKLIALKVW